MGGRKSQTVGYKYYLGMHVVACQSPIDGITALNFGDRTAWEGFANDTQLQIDKPKLFGGDSREGGVGGFIDVMGGGPEQAQNDYLANSLRPGELVSAARGVVSLVFRRFWWGNNPYIKPMRIKVQNVFATFGNWLPGIAGVNGEYAFNSTAVHLALDVSLSLSTQEFAAQKAAAKAFVDQFQNSVTSHLRIQPYSDAPVTAFERFNVDAADIAAAKDYIDGLIQIFGTDYNAAVSTAQQFFSDAINASPVGAQAVNFVTAATGGSGGVEDVSVSEQVRQVIVFISDGSSVGTSGTAAATIAAIPGVVEVFAVGLGTEGDLADVDNTAADGVPVITDTEDAEQIANIILGGFSSFLDINPIHMARDVLISPVTDGSGDAAEIGDTFAPAAQTCFEENMGLSLFWQNSGDRDSFIRKIEQHVNCAFYEDYSTGKWEVQLIRPGDVSQFTFTNIKRWQEYDKPQQAELPNSITLVGTKRDNGSDAAVTLHNVAAIQVTGRVINEKVEMEGITWPALRQKVAERELLQRTVPLGKGAFYYPYLPTDVRQGRKITIDEPNMGINNMVCRVTEIDESNPATGEVLIRFTEDVNNVDMTQTSFAADDSGTVANRAALPANVVFFEEVSYFDQVLLRTQAEIDDDLTVDPGLGSWQITCDQPGPLHLDAAVVRYDYPDWIDVAEGPLMPTWVLDADLSSAADVTTFTCAETGREFELEVGQIIQVGTERMRLDSVSISSGVSTFTVGRGCLDTVPQSHLAGSYVMAWDNYVFSDEVDYTDGESITTRITPRTSQEALPIDLASDNDLTMASRAFRPLPVGRLQLDGSYLPVGIQSGTVTLTWQHRSRILQTTDAIQDHTAANIGPEDGVSYHLVRRIIEASGGTESVGYTVEEPLSPEQVLTVDVDVDDAAFSVYATGDSVAIEIGIKTKRESSPEYENWQTPFIRMETAYAQAPVPSSSGSADAEYTVTVAGQGSALSGFAMPIDLSNAPASFWLNVATGGVNIRAFQGGVQIPCHVHLLKKNDQSGEVWVKADLGTSATDITLRLTSDTALPARNSTYGSNNVFTAYDVFMIGGASIQNQVDGSGPTILTSSSIAEAAPEVATSGNFTNVHEGFIYDEAGDRWFGIDEQAIRRYGPTGSPSLPTGSALDSNTDPHGDVTTFLNDGTTYTDMNMGFYNPANGYLYVGVFDSIGTTHAIARFDTNTAGLPLVDAYQIEDAGVGWAGSDYTMVGDEIYAIGFNPAGVNVMSRANLAPPFTFIESVALSDTIFYGQGIHWHEPSQCFYVAGTAGGASDSTMFRVDRDGTVSQWGRRSFDEQGVTGSELDIYRHNTDAALDRLRMRSTFDCEGLYMLNSPTWFDGISIDTTFTFGVGFKHYSNANKFLASLIDMTASDGANERVSLFRISGNPRFESGFGASVINSAGGTAISGAFRFDLRLDGSNYELFRNAVSQGTSAIDSIANISRFALGDEDGAGSTTTFNGDVSVAYLSDDALSDDWISALYDLTLSNAANVTIVAA